MSALPRRRTALIATAALIASLFAVGAPVAASAASTGGITGTVTSAGHPLAGVDVSVYQRLGTGASAYWSWAAEMNTSAAGAYAFPGLDAGTYIVDFTPASGQNAVSEWYDHKTSQDTATQIPVSSTVVTADEDLPLGSIVTGKITRPASATAARPEATLLVPDQKSGYNRWKGTDPQLTAVAKADGTYRIVGVPAGTYTVLFDDSAFSGTVASQYYGGSANITLAKPFTVSASTPTAVSTRTGINATLARGATVAGKITDAFGKPVANAEVRVALKLTVDGKPMWEWGSLPVDPKTGVYSVKGLSAGTYAVGFAADQGYADSYYGGGHSFDTAKTFTLTAGSARTGVNGTLLHLPTTAASSITGMKAVGSTLTAHHGTWTTGTSFTYQWFANGAYITGSTSTHPAFTLTAAQQGKQISVKITGRKAGYVTASRTSARTLRVTLTARPTISGTPRVGSMLTAHHGTWTTGMAFTYRWFAAGVAISGATHPTVTLTAAQRGKAITVVVTGSEAGYQTASRRSAATAAVG
jgi:hypothetical protein